MAVAPEEQQEIARLLFEAASGRGESKPSIDGWTVARAQCIALGDWATVDERAFDGAGNASGQLWSPAGEELMDLKDAMVDEHGGWFSATCTVERDGGYAFAFNYDAQEPLQWFDGYEIPDETWKVDLMRYPRPWAEIPEWHLVKKTYTEESWAREVAANAEG